MTDERPRTDGGIGAVDAPDQEKPPLFEEDIPEEDLDGDDGDEWSHPPVRPSLQVLQRDQRRLIFGADEDEAIDEEGVYGGLSSPRELIEWYQRLAIRTFGYIAEPTEALQEPFTPGQIAGDVILRYCLLEDVEEAQAVEESRKDPVDRQHTDRIGPVESINEAIQDLDVRDYRERLVNLAILPASREAFRDLRGRSGEYTGESDQDLDELDLDPTAQKYIAMRPGYDELDREQTEALNELWSGFDSRQDLQRWIHDLNHPTHGEIQGDLYLRLQHDDVALFHLIDSYSLEELLRAVDVPKPRRFLRRAGVDLQDVERSRREYRNRFAIGVLLPAFTAAAQELSAGERAERSGSPSKTFHFQ